MLSPVIRVGLTRRDAATPKRACGMAALGASLHALAMANAASPTLRRHGIGDLQRDPQPPPGAARNGACSSAGEHYVDIVGVTGSIPVTPTISSSRKMHEYSGIWRMVASFPGIRLRLA